MGDFDCFDATIEPLAWGQATYTILRLPDPVSARLVAAGAKRVEGTVNDVEINLALVRAPVVDGQFLWAGDSLMRRIGVSPGEPLSVRVRPVDPDLVVLPDDVGTAIAAAGAGAAWQTLSAGRQRSALYRIESARTQPTRQRRIAELVARLIGPPAEPAGR
ncbi:MAG: YdeI/OmpD-associated family protein [Nocardioides sp.]